MTLSLDDVRSKRFRLARKSGYEVAEVDDFLDQVQESFAQLVEETETLRQQVESLGSDQPAAVGPAREPAQQREPIEPEPIVVTTAAEASAAVVRLVQLSTEQAEQLVAEAAEEAQRVRAEADASAQRLSTDSHAEADRLEAEAREQAETLRADAQGRAQQLDAETDHRREQLFGDLDAERALLAAAVQDLRHFEQSFRSNLSDHLRRQLTVLESGGAEPANVPELAPTASAAAVSDPTDTGQHDTGQQDTGQQDSGQQDSGRQDSSAADAPASDEADEDGSIETDPDATVQVSDTPRLDALLGDQR